MKSKASKINKASIEWANESARRHCKNYIERAEKLKNDTEKQERLKKCKCKACFYLNNQRFGGQAITHKDCGICENEMTFGSTATNNLCIECAKENSLCVQCGGDIEMKNRRLPRPYENEKLEAKETL